MMSVAVVEPEGWLCLCCEYQLSSCTLHSKAKPRHMHGHFSTTGKQSKYL
jgi:hypothetical protein